jgi:hypothetical protein
MRLILFWVSSGYFWIGLLLGMGMVVVIRRRHRKKAEDSAYAGSDEENFFRQRYPEASCFKVNLCWPGQKTRRRWIVTRAPWWSGVDGSGSTRAEAWKSAEERLKQKLPRA